MSLDFIDVPDCRSSSKTINSIFLLSKLATRVPQRGPSFQPQSAPKPANPSLDAKLFIVHHNSEKHTKSSPMMCVQFDDEEEKKNRVFRSRALDDDSMVRAFLASARQQAIDLTDVRLHEAMSLMALLAVPRADRLRVLLEHLSVHNN